MSKLKTCLCITGTIEPGKVPNLKRIDPLQREQDYYFAIKKWLQLGYSTVFVENSGYNSTLIKSLFEGKVDCEYISFKSKISHLGKSHGEAEILRYAFSTSEVIKKSTNIVKVSGRQYVINSMDILKILKEEKIYVIAWLKGELHYADSRFFIANIDFYDKYLFKEFSSINESKHIYIEHILARAILRSMADGKQWTLPNEYPIYKGVSGTDNTRYKNNLYTIIKGNIIVKLTKRLLKSEYL